MGWPRSRLLSTVGRLRVHLLDGLATGDGAEQVEQRRQRFDQGQAARLDAMTQT